MKSNMQRIMACYKDVPRVERLLESYIEKGIDLSVIAHEEEYLFKIRQKEKTPITIGLLKHVLEEEFSPTQSKEPWENVAISINFNSDLEIK